MQLARVREEPGGGTPGLALDPAGRCQDRCPARLTRLYVGLLPRPRRTTGRRLLGTHRVASTPSPGRPSRRQTASPSCGQDGLVEVVGCGAAGRRSPRWWHTAAEPTGAGLLRQRGELLAHGGCRRNGEAVGRRLAKDRRRRSLAIWGACGRSPLRRTSRAWSRRATTGLCGFGMSPRGGQRRRAAGGPRSREPAARRSVASPCRTRSPGRRTVCSSRRAATRSCALWDAGERVGENEAARVAEGSVTALAFSPQGNDARRGDRRARSIRWDVESLVPRSTSRRR